MPGPQMDQEEANELLGFLSGSQERGDEDILQDVLGEEREEGAALLESLSEAGLIDKLLC